MANRQLAYDLSCGDVLSERFIVRLPAADERWWSWLWRRVRDALNKSRGWARPGSGAEEGGICRQSGGVASPAGGVSSSTAGGTSTFLLIKICCTYDALVPQ